MGLSVRFRGAVAGVLALGLVSAAQNTASAQVIIEPPLDPDAFWEGHGAGRRLRRGEGFRSFIPEQQERRRRPQSEEKFVFNADEALVLSGKCPLPLTRNPDVDVDCARHIALRLQHYYINYVKPIYDTIADRTDLHPVTRTAARDTERSLTYLCSAIIKSTSSDNPKQFLDVSSYCLDGISKEERALTQLSAPFNSLYDTHDPRYNESATIFNTFSYLLKCYENNRQAACRTLDKLMSGPRRTDAPEIADSVSPL